MNRENHKVVLTPSPSLAAVDHTRPTLGTILHPTDYSAASRQAFELACRIARDRGSRLVVMHVAEPVRISSFGMAPVPPLPKGYRGAWESRLRLLQSADPNVRVEHRLEEGDVVAAILRVARETHCDLIVMAGRDRTWLGRLLFGSVAGTVERKARCPVLRVDTHQLEVAGSTPWSDSRGTKESTRRCPPFSVNGEDHDPTDFSTSADKAFQAACSLARDRDAPAVGTVDHR